LTSEESPTGSIAQGAPHPDVGRRVTADGHIHEEVRADGRYDGARGARASAYTGRYTVGGSRFDDIADTGFTATGDVRDGVLSHTESG